MFPDAAELQRERQATADAGAALEAQQASHAVELQRAGDQGRAPLRRLTGAAAEQHAALKVKCQVKPRRDDDTCRRADFGESVSGIELLPWTDAAAASAHIDSNWSPTFLTAQLAESHTLWSQAKLDAVRCDARARWRQLAAQCERQLQAAQVTKTFNS